MAKSTQGKRWSSVSWLLVGTSFLTACSVVDPQFVSKPLMLSRYDANSCTPTLSGGEASAEQASTTCQPKVGDTPYYGELPLAIDQVNQLRYDYMYAVRTETAWPNVIGAAMLPLTAMTVYKGVTSSGDSTQRWLTKAGLLAGSGYIFGTTFVSKPRARIYLAGADALGCAVLSSRPMLYSKDNAAALRANVKRLEADIAKVDAAMASSHDALVTMRSVLEADRKDGECKRPGKASVQALVDVSDRSKARDKSAEGVRYRACDGMEKNRTRDLTTRKGVLNALSKRQEAFVKRRNKLVTLAAEGRSLLDRLDAAGTVLREKAIAIQNQVAAEVLKTEPDLGAIMQSVGGLKSFAYKFSGASPLAPPALPASGAGTPAAESASVSEEDVEKGIASTGQGNTEAAITQAEADAQAVYQSLADASALSRTVVDLNACKLVLPANQLAVQPDVEDVTVSVGSKAEFVVSGGVGVPQAHLVGVGTSKAKLDPVTVSGAAYMVTVTVAAAIADSDQVLLHLTDSSGQAPRTIRIKSLEVGAASGDQAAMQVVDKMSGPKHDALCSKFNLKKSCAAHDVILTCLTGLKKGSPVTLDDKLADELIAAAGNVAGCATR